MPLLGVSLRCPIYRIMPPMSILNACSITSSKCASADTLVACLSSVLPLRLVSSEPELTAEQASHHDAMQMFSEWQLTLIMCPNIASVTSSSTLIFCRQKDLSTYMGALQFNMSHQMKSIRYAGEISTPLQACIHTCPTRATHGKD